MEKFIITRKAIAKESDGTVKAFYAVTYDKEVVGIELLHIPATNGLNAYWAVTPSGLVPDIHYPGNVDYFHVSMILRHMRHVLEKNLKKSTGHWMNVEIWL